MHKESLAKIFFEEQVLPRRVWDPNQNNYRKVLNGEKNKGELYPLCSKIFDSTADFGIGVGAYFADLFLITATFIVCGCILSPVIIYFGGPSYSGSSTWPSAVCTYSNVTAISNCPDNKINCEVTKANDCEITNTMIICDVAMCIFFIFVLFMNVKIQKFVENELDEEVQTVQDYSVVVKDPNDDASNPEEWRRFFSAFGTVRYVTITRCNNQLIQLLYKKKALLQRLKELLLKENKGKMPSVTNNSLSITKSKYTFNPRESLLRFNTHQNNMIEWNENFNGHIKNVDTLYVQSQMTEPVATSMYMKLRLFFGIASTKLELIIALKQLEVVLTEAFRQSYPVDRIYVTFEHENQQKLALETLEVPDYLAGSDSAYQNRTKFVFRGENVLDVCESDEPDAVLWPNTQVNPTRKIIIFFINIIIIAGFVFIVISVFILYSLVLHYQTDNIYNICLIFVGILVACYVAISKVQNLAKDMTPLLIIGIDLILPFIIRFLTDIEKKNSETIRQKELHRRLFFGKLLIVTIFPYIATSWNEFLLEEKLIAVRNTQFLTSFVSPIIFFCDFYGIFQRHIYGHLMISNQKEYNEIWEGMDWTLAERYVEAAKTLCIIIFSTFLLPQSLFIGAISFILVLFLDRYSLLRKWKKIPKLGLSVCKVFRKEIMLAIAIHMYATSRWIYSWPMDSSTLITPATSTSPAVYGYVDKYPSPFIWRLKADSTWMNNAQMNWVFIYTILTLVSISLAIYMWIIESLFTHGRKYFCVLKKASGADASHDLFSHLQGVNVYLPIHQVGANQYFTIPTDNMLLRHLENSILYHQNDSNFDLIDLVPKQYRNHVLGTIKWFAENGEVIEQGGSSTVAVSSIMANKNDQKNYTESLSKSLSNKNLKSSVNVSPLDSKMKSRQPLPPIVREKEISNDLNSIPLYKKDNIQISNILKPLDISAILSTSNLQRQQITLDEILRPRIVRPAKFNPDRSVVPM